MITILLTRSFCITILLTGAYDRGDGTAFRDAAAFRDEIGKRGTGALELVAMHMKSQGSFLCRSLSFRGAEFQIVNRAPSIAFQHMVCCEL